jgi:hypothetical protein
MVANSAAQRLNLRPRADIVAALPQPADPDNGGLRVLFRPDEGNLDGRYADNPWLLEMPAIYPIDLGQRGASRPRNGEAARCQNP